MANALALQDPPYRVGSYSIDGNQKILQGDGEPARIINRKSGIDQFTYYSTLGETLANLSAARARSVFAETYGSSLGEAFEQSEGLGATLESAQVSDEYAAANAAYDPNSQLCQQFEQVTCRCPCRSISCVDTSTFPSLSLSLGCQAHQPAEQPARGGA